MLFLEALWFFLPILAANQCPGLAAQLGLPGAHTPVLRKWLGENKTVAAYYAAPLGSLGIIYIQQYLSQWSEYLGLFDYNRSDLWFIGLLFGLGAALGDHIKSFFKRRLGIQPGARWWPFDQLDFVVGGILFALPMTGWIGFERVAIICAFVLLIHPIGNHIGYWLGLRKVPW